MKPIAIVLLALAVAACGETTYEKPGGTTAEFKAASYACERDAQTLYPGATLGVALAFRGMYRRCMDSKGWEVR